MIKTILGILGLIGIGTICLLVLLACIASSWIKERGLKNETKHK